MTFPVRRATAGDVPQVVELIRGAAQWLGSRGSDQWQEFTRERVYAMVERDIAAGIMFVVAAEVGTVVAVASIDDYADPEFWNEGVGSTLRLMSDTMDDWDVLRAAEHPGELSPEDTDVVVDSWGLDDEIAGIMRRLGLEESSAR